MVKSNQRAHYLTVLFLVISLVSGAPLVSAGLEGPVVDAISYYNQAVDAAASGDDEKAMELISQALSIQPDFYLAQVTKASLLMNNEQYIQAEEILNQAEREHPDNPYILSAKASLYVNTGKYQEAVHAADQALEIDPTLIEAWILKGTAHGGLGQFSEEINASESALQLDPENPGAQSNYQFAQKGLILQSEETRSDDAEQTPLPGLVVLEAALFSVLLHRRTRR